jgi:hypothetical protein
MTIQNAMKKWQCCRSALFWNIQYFQGFEVIPILESPIFDKNRIPIVE